MNKIFFRNVFALLLVVVLTLGIFFTNVKDTEADVILGSPIGWEYPEVGNSTKLDFPIDSVRQGGYPLYPSIYVHNGIIYMAYTSAMSKGAKLNVAKYDGTKWVQVGAPDFSPGAAIRTSMYVSNDGVPYVAFENAMPVQSGNYNDSNFKDIGLGNSAVLVKFDGTKWVQVGKAVGENAANVSLSFSNGIPYITYKDIPTGNVNVKKYDGTNWVSVGSSNIVNVGAYGQNFLYVDNGVPYLEYLIPSSESSKPMNVSVMKFNGTKWVQVGMANFSETSLFDMSDGQAISVYKGVPYVVTRNTGGLSVMKYDGTNWVDVGSLKNFNIKSYFAHPRMYIDTNGDIYLGIQTGGCCGNYFSQLMKYDGTKWVTLAANEGFSGHLSLFVDSDTLYFAVGKLFMNAKPPVVAESPQPQPVVAPATVPVSKDVDVESVSAPTDVKPQVVVETPKPQPVATPVTVPVSKDVDMQSVSVPVKSAVVASTSSSFLIPATTTLETTTPRKTSPAAATSTKCMITATYCPRMGFTDGQTKQDSLTYTTANTNKSVCMSRAKGYYNSCVRFMDNKDKKKVKIKSAFIKNDVEDGFVWYPSAPASLQNTPATTTVSVNPIQKKSFFSYLLGNVWSAVSEFLR